MKIVVLDGYTLNPGDLSWAGLEALGETRVFDRTAPNAVAERARDAEIVLTNKTKLPAAEIGRLPQLRYIGVLATGYNVVDVAAATARGIAVSNVPTYGTRSVAQMTFAHILHLTQRVADHASEVRNGEWSRAEDFCFWRHPLIELAGSTMGVVGLGRIGRSVADLALAFGMNVLAFDPSSSPGNGLGIRMTDWETLLREADVISLHCPLTDANRHMIDERSISSMKRSAILVNTSRGPLVDEAALARALNEGRLAGAGLDVLETEPPGADCPLLSARNCFITPHIAWATYAARKRLMDEVVENVKAFISGTLRNVVNEEILQGGCR